MRLRKIASKARGQSFDEMVRLVVDELAATYPGHIEKELNWFFSLAGGAKGIMTVLHGSLSEYLILFGAPIGTEGFSGRYRIDIYDIVLAGEMYTYNEGHPGEPVHSKPGDMAILRRGEVKGFKLLQGCWLLEYGCGPVPTSIPIALGDAVFSAMDGTTIAKSFWNYGRLVVKELLQGKI